MQNQMRHFLLYLLLSSCFVISCKSNSNHSKEIVTTANTTEITNRFPSPLGFVSDFEQIFSLEQRLELEKTLKNYEKESEREIAIVTVNSIEPYLDIASYSMDLANEWGIGKADKDNGLLILISSSLREVRISTGYGTEKKLTDKICKEIIDQMMIPQFKIERYFEGVQSGLSELIKKWD